MNLFEITTEAVRIVWSGPVPTPAVLPSPAPRPFGLRVSRLDEGEPVRVQVSENAQYLFEETTYTVFVRSHDTREPGVRHPDPVLIGALQRPAPDTLHGPVAFGSQVGKSRFIVTLDGEPHVRIEMEIMPSKLEYRQDYRALVEDVARVADDLALQHVAAAFHEGGVAEARGGARGEVALLEALAEELDQALRRAFAQPARSIVRVREAEALHRVRRPDAALVRRLARHAAHGGALVAPTARWSLDTPEHRWIDVRLAALDARLARRLERPARTARQQASQSTLRRLRQHLAAWREAEPLRAAQQGQGAAPTLRLRRTPGYREAARVIEALSRRFSLGVDTLPFRLRDLHRLYEYACLLWIAEALARATHQPLDVQQLVHPDASGLDLRLRTGRQKLVFALPEGGRAVLRYVPRLAAPGALLPQRPDFLLAVERPGGSPRHYVLDAKYRLDTSPQTVARFGIPGPPPQALGALHRYRDAIVERAAGRVERRVAEAVVLYPWRDDGRYEKSALARSIEEIGVGAIPVLPGATAHLDAWLARVLGFSASHTLPT